MEEEKRQPSLGEPPLMLEDKNHYTETPSERTRSENWDTVTWKQKNITSSVQKNEGDLVPWRFSKKLLVWIGAPKLLFLETEDMSPPLFRRTYSLRDRKTGLQVP